MDRDVRPDDVNVKRIVALTWNTCHGAATGHAWRVADANRADVVMLQEATTTDDWGSACVGEAVLSLP